MIERSDFSLEIKELSEGGHIEGLIAAFGNVDHGGDRIMPGAFKSAIGTSVPMLLHHKQDRPIGRWHEMAETSDGLHAKGKLTRGVRDADEAYALAKDGALTGLSVGYTVRRDGYSGKARELHDVQLFEASLVAVPMNDRARVTSVKAITGPSDIADLLRDGGGMSGRRAKAAAGAAWAAINDSADEAEADANLINILEKSAARIAAMGRS
jgi:hypothetical protein|tara:strand:+ start:3380 stop:4012 length:633 start_codon:yes stop_codon:yes gene_type:complete